MGTKPVSPRFCLVLVLRGRTLKLPLGSDLSALWAGTPDGVVPVPPAPK
jgi:hypothetical protein